MNLPIDGVLPKLKRGLSLRCNVVLAAAPGAGKTTKVPLAFIDEPWLNGKKILILEPRRLAARTAAQYMAKQLGERVGEIVGYRLRHETQISDRTKIEVITEGILTRMLQTDPSLEGIGMVIFDEFHERSIHADLGLALCLQSQEIFRDDLRLLVMSATMNEEAVARLLGDAPVIRSEGKAYPVELRYLEQMTTNPIELTVVHLILEALSHHEGDILVFLPGAREIQQVEHVLQSHVNAMKDVQIYALFGSLSVEQQDLAVAPSREGQRKIVLATNIAETSLTIEGVRVVVDSGLQKVARFSTRTGLTRLETVSISRDSADQRAGRAGRLAPGVCYRCWSLEEERLMQPHRTAEILEADLSGLKLELAMWGVTDAHELSWIDPPPKHAIKQAETLLVLLGALDGQGVITAHGQQMVRLPAAPRLAHMLLSAEQHGYGELACYLSALIGEKEMFRDRQLAKHADIQTRIDVLSDYLAAGKVSRYSDSQVDLMLINRIKRDALQLEQHLNRLKDVRQLQRSRSEQRTHSVRLSEPQNDRHLALLEQFKLSGTDHITGLLLSYAFPDRIAQKRPDGRYLLANGRGAILHASDNQWSRPPYVVAVEVEDHGVDSSLLLAAEIKESDLYKHRSDLMTSEPYYGWDRESESVRVSQRWSIGAIVMKAQPLQQADPNRILEVLLDAIQGLGLNVLNWNKPAKQLLQRMRFMHSIDTDFPDVSDVVLLSQLRDWLGPHLYGIKSLQQVKALNLCDILKSMLSWEQLQQLETEAPVFVQVPSGSRIPVQYDAIHAPYIAVRLQECFGLTRTPTVGKGRVPLTLHLLSPAQRPIQITRDLESFWKGTYYEVKKDLKGRYPKHYWPDDPFQAVPTRRVRPNA